MPMVTSKKKVYPDTKLEAGGVREMTVGTYYFRNDGGLYEVYYDSGEYMILYWKRRNKRRDPYHVATASSLDDAKAQIQAHREWYNGRRDKSGRQRTFML